MAIFSKKIFIKGMHCRSCEILIEREFRKISNIIEANVSYKTGQALVKYRKSLPLEEIRQRLRQFSYKLIDNKENINAQALTDIGDGRRNYYEAIILFMVVLSFYFVLKETGLLGKLSLGTQEVSFGIAVILGLIASVSTCMAVTGSLLLGISAEITKHFSQANFISKFKPHLYFNLGRILSYTLFGGLIGWLGSFFSLSGSFSGIVIIVLSIFMIVLGLHLLELLNGLSWRLMPKSLINLLEANIDTRSEKGIFLLGGLTFFLPCGFTQALQLYVLTRGNSLEGSLIMLFFALGTLPALMLIGLISSYVKGLLQRYFVKLAGAIVVIVGAFNLVSGASLLGFNINIFSSSSANSLGSDFGPNITFTDGVQIVSMEVDQNGRYAPNFFKIKAGMPLKWEINVKNPYTCASVLVVPAYNIVKRLSPGYNLIEFTPRQAGKINFSCSMGMFRGSFMAI